MPSIIFQSGPTIRPKRPMLRLVSFSAQFHSCSVVPVDRIPISPNERDNIVLISFRQLSIEDDEDGQKRKQRMVEVLTEGVEIAGELYSFLGHTAEQAFKSMCYLYRANSHKEIMSRLDGWGHFNQIPDVIRRSREIGRHVLIPTEERLHSAKLNEEIVGILSTLGVPDSVFMQKQDDHFQYIESALEDKSAALDLLRMHGDDDNLEELNKYTGYMLSVPHAISENIVYAQREEQMLSLLDTRPERIRILIPASRLLLAQIDTSGILRPGECYVQLSTGNFGTLKGSLIVIQRHFLHPGDVQKFTAVDIPELEHLVDVIVFPAGTAWGTANYNEWKFFVTWDRDLFPAYFVPPPVYHAVAHIPFHYPEAPHLDLIQYFVNCDVSILKDVLNRYKKWIRFSPERAMSVECQNLATIYARAYDGDLVSKSLGPGQVPRGLRRVGGKFIVGELIKGLEKYSELMEILNTQW